MKIAVHNFLDFLKTPSRSFVISPYGRFRLKLRSINEKSCMEDLLSRKPVAVTEQDCETEGERKFRAYYSQTDDMHHVYIICVNKAIRLITAWRTSKSIQRKWAGNL